MSEMETIGAEPKRDGYGRYLIVPDGGGKATAMTRATTVAGVLESRHNIEKWQQRHLAVGLAGRPDLLAQVQSTTIDDKRTLNEVCKKALDASGSDAAASLGTALHRVVELVNRHPDAPVPDAFAERIEVYRALMAAHGVEVVADCVERIHVLSAMGIAGMADAHVRIGGRRYIFDLKTGSSLAFAAGSFAVQLAIYANATSLYDPATETHDPMPLDVDRERAVICHLPAKGGPASLHWIDIAAGAEALRHAHFGHRWRSRRDLLSDVEPLRPSAEVIADAFPGTVVDEAGTAALLIDRQGRVLAALPPVDDAFKARWRAELPDVRGPKQSATWSHEDLDAIERAFELPFTDVSVPAPPVVETVAPVVELRPAPDLGGPVDPGALQVLRDRAKRQSNGVKAWVRRWQEEATAADAMQWKMGRGAHVTLWSFEVSRAALYLARVVEQAETPDAGLETVRRCLAVVVGDLATQAGVEVGDVLAHLSLDEATRLADLATTVDTDGPGSLEVAS